MTIKEVKIQLALGSLTDEVRRGVADNKRTSKEVLTILSKDEDWCVRCSIAENLNTTKEVLTKLSKDKSWNVRYCVAKAPRQLHTRTADLDDARTKTI